MAISVEDTYPGRAVPGNANYPEGAVVNETVPKISDDGTPLDDLWGNDFEGLKQSLMRLNGTVPSPPGNIPDTAVNSQILQAIVELSAGRAINYDDTGAADVYVASLRANQQGVAGYFDGLIVELPIANDGTGAGTIDVEGKNGTLLGVKDIKTDEGLDPVAGFITGRLKLRFDLANNWFEIIPAAIAGFIHVRDEKPSGTTGGASAVGLNTRTLNTVLTNTIAGASLATNQVTLPAGTYRISGSAPAYAIDTHRVSLYNVTDASFEIFGTSEYANFTGAHSNRSFVRETITITATKVFELRHDVQTANANGLGLQNTDGNIEVYSDLEIRKVR